MADFTNRHGDGMHFMRPDRVYRTSVLAPMVGYQPPADVEAVAMAFTQGAERGMMLQGLGAMPAPVERFLARLRAWIAERRAKKLMSAGMPAPHPMPPTASGVPRMPPQPMNGLGMPGPAPGMAQQIAPQLAAQMAGLMAIQKDRYGVAFPAAQAQALIDRPLRQWYR